MLGKELLIFDGAMGSLLEERVPGHSIPEDLNITHPQVVRDIHLEYGVADCITTNTFGLNPLKYRGAYDLGQVAEAAISHARVTGKQVFFDVGPSGALMAPIGTLTFDGAYEAYATIARLTAHLVDGYICETFSDLLELKACVLALKEHTDKPIFATMTFDSTGRTLCGTTPEIAARTLSALGVDAMGANCSLGPKEMKGVVEELLRHSSVPVILQPNMGLPTLRDGKTYYPLTQEEFLNAVTEYRDMGVSVLGGCCGTTPSLIRRMCSLRGPISRPRAEEKTYVCSATRSAEWNGGVRVCGERLNPTGKKALKAALLEGDYDYLTREAMAQEEAGADLLDLNVGVPGIDEAKVMVEACQSVQGVCNLPLQIDSSSPDALEAGARYYNGIPLLNSVNGERSVMERVFPIAKKYGAVVLGLTMDAQGVPKTASERYEIARRIVDCAGEYGIPPHRILIDTLTLTASAEQSQVKETLEALRLVRTLGVNTALGVSNVSFGLPARSLLNKTFLTMAMTCGLTMPILNPCDSEMMGAVRAFSCLTGEDKGCEKYISAYGNSTPVATPTTNTTDLAGCVLHGLRGGVTAATLEALKTLAPLEVVEQVLIPTLEKVGAEYEAGRLFLPQLICAAEVAKDAFAVLEEKFPSSGTSRGTVVLATVQGDVHDIGKNIVKVVLQSYGFTVMDLGRDVSPEQVVEAALESHPVAVGLSALMTTTVPAMEETVRRLKAAGITAPIYVGGAVLTSEIASAIGADEYVPGAAEFARSLLARLDV